MIQPGRRWSAPGSKCLAPWDFRIGPNGYYRGCYHGAEMAKISVSLDDELYGRVRDAAGPAGVSGWLADAASARLRAEALSAVADEIAESTGGAYTDSELAKAREWLRLSSTPAH